MKGYKELLETVKMIQATGGMDIGNDAVCEYQDMIGHSSIEQLEELAAGNCREAFYRLYDAAYGTISTLRFYWQHSEKAQALQEAAQAADRERMRIRDYAETADKELERRAKVISDQEDKIIEAEEKATAAEQRAKAAEAESIQLKAKLYDLMNK